MLMRLWWKDARQFWPIWAFLILAAIVTQGLFLHYGGPEVRQGYLGMLALCWAALYAFAVAAAAFAGERETGTLRFLDILPASRPVVWTGKVSFAFATTAVLAAILLVIAALGSESWTIGLSNQERWFGLPLVGLLVVALVLGLLCSSMMSNALLAALASMGLATLAWIGLLASLEQYNRPGRRDWSASLAWTIGLTLISFVGSYIAFTWSRRNQRSSLRIQLRSPIELSWVGPSGTSLAPVRTRSSDFPDASGVATERMPIVMPASLASPTAWPADRPGRRSRFTEFRHLTRQTIREGGKIWFYLMALGLIVPGGVLLLSAVPISPFPFVVWNWLVALMAGVSVFGLENQRRTYRFLVHHGARPGTVWLAKLMTWCIGLALIWVPLACLAVSSARMSPPPLPSEDRLWLLLTLPLVFAVAQLCGMAIPRGITAGVIAIVVTIALGAAQVALIYGKMMPAWGLLVPPAAFLVVTWAWSGDWLLDRPAPGRYLRLALILAGTFGVILAGYAGERAWSIPDPGPIAAPSAWADAAALAPDRNAADLYREAARLALPMPERSISMTYQNYLDLQKVIDSRSKALDLIRQAAARPACRFQQPERLTLLSRSDLPPMRELAGLVTEHARGRLGRNDLAGAWDDIVVLLRMARHTSEGATMFQALQALAIEQEALDLARAWSIVPGQTPERLHSAIVAYRDLPRLSPAAEAVRGETILFERTIDLPMDDIMGLLLEMIVGPTPLANGHVPPWASFYINMITTPWERERTRRVNRRFASYLIRQAALEPRLQQLGPRLTVARDLESAPLARYLGANVGACIEADNRNEVARRALVQVMAIRAWQLRHDGRLPDRLEALVPDELPSLPTDPYTGRPYDYGKTPPNSAVLSSPIPMGRNRDLSDAYFQIPPLATPKSTKPDDRGPGTSGGRDGEPAKPQEPAKPASAKPPAQPGSRP